jgi:hypothetical protein
MSGQATDSLAGRKEKAAKDVLNANARKDVKPVCTRLGIENYLVSRVR